MAEWQVSATRDHGRLVESSKGVTPARDRRWSKNFLPKAVVLFLLLGNESQLEEKVGKVEP